MEAYFDFHFYHDVTHPTTQLLRREVPDRIRLNPPAFLILFEQT